jgi:hypothetical protein
MTSEFNHYDGCGLRDPDNCSGCALTTGGPEGPNYSAWPLAYMQNRRTIPAKWLDAFVAELASDNKIYAANVRRHIEIYGVSFR